ncbi:MAG: hypothetical protein FJX03_07370 [Alphaproteobacteria bacterium]|nr:hypothetical protein [Alphaproteobacteria bacterium]
MKVLNSKFLLSLLVVAWWATPVLASDKTTGQEEKATPTSQPTTQTPPDKVEPLGLEGGDFVNKPSDLADRIGNKIEQVADNLFGNKKEDKK